MTPPTHRRDLVAGASVLLVTVALVRLGVDREMLVHVHSLHSDQPVSDAEVPVIEHVRVVSHGVIWLARFLLLAAVIAWTVPARQIVETYDCDLFRSDSDHVVMGWLLPPLNVGAPYLMMADIWTASHPSRRPDAIVDRLKVPKGIGLWWSLFGLSAILSGMALIDEWKGASPWQPFGVHLDMASLTLQIVSAVLLVWIVVRTTGFIERRAAAVAGSAL